MLSIALLLFFIQSSNNYHTLNVWAVKAPTKLLIMLAFTDRLWDKYQNIGLAHFVRLYAGCNAPIWDETVEAH